MEGLLEWLSTLPLWALYGAMSCLAMVENIFPPIPADSIVALGSFLAARGQGSPLAAFLATWVGNVVGAMAMYAAGRRWGTAFLDRWLRRSHTSEKHEHRLELLYQRYGLLALGVSRFIPGVRALVPPFAGAMRLGAVKVLLVVAIPSGVWYGLVTYLAFTVGTKLDAAVDSVKSAQLWTTVVALVLVGGLVGLWLLAKRRRSRL